MIPLNQIKGVVTHKHTDIDALVATAMLRYAILQQFPKREIEVYFVEKPWPLAELIERGCVALDMGWQGLSKDERENPLAEDYVVDHHRTGQNKSTTKMVAEALDFLDKGLVDDLVEYVDIHDLEGTAFLSSELMSLEHLPPQLISRARLLERSALSVLPTILRGRHKDKGLLKFFYHIVTDSIDHRKRFQVVVAKEYKSKVKIVPLWIVNKQENMAIIESTISEVVAFSKTEAGGYCAVTILKNPEDGNVQVLVNQWRRPAIDLGEVAKIIRVLEMGKRNIFEEYYLRVLSEEGMIDICPFWFVAKNTKGVVWAVMNGSRKHEVEPTALTLEEIKAAVIVAIDENILHPQCPQTYCLLDKCPFYPFGLSRCEKI